MKTGSADDRSRAGDRSEESFPLGGFQAGTTVLVAGPPLVGKYDLVLEVLARGTAAGEGSVVVSTRGDERAVVEDFERISAGFDRSGLGVVECVSGKTGGTDTDDDQVRVHRAGSPGDLTGIGIGASELMNDFADDGTDGVRIGLDSVSTLLLYSEFDRMCRFLHVLSGRIDRAGGLGMFVLNPGTIDATQFDQLKTLFDGLVELRERDERRELRVRGLAEFDPTWRAYERS